MPTVSKTLGEGTQSVLMTVAILECVAQRKGLVSVSDLARQIGTSKSRVFRHLRTLVQCEYVSQEGVGGQYGAGSKLIALSRAMSDAHDIAAIAASVMLALREDLEHTVIVSRFENEGMRVLKSISGDANIVLEVRAGTLLPFIDSAQGRIAIAFATQDCSADLPTLKAARSAFMQDRSDEILKVRETGLAVAQMRPGLIGMAAPIFDARENLIGTLALLNTVAAMSSERNSKSALALRDSAQLLSNSFRQMERS